MRKSILFSLILLLPLMYLHCLENSTDPTTATDSDKQVVPDYTITVDSTLSLMVGQTALILPDSMILGFVEVSDDSRCPMNAYCFWAGTAQIRIWLLMPGYDTVYTDIGLAGSARDFIGALIADSLGFRISLDYLRPYPPSFDPIDQSEYIATIGVQYSNDDPPPIDRVIIVDTPPAHLQRDQFQLAGITIDGNYIDIALGFSGGCRSHYFWLFMSPPTFGGAFPPQADLYIQHYANNDMCEAYLADVLRFDLSPIGQSYFDTYGQIDSIMINVYEYFQNTPGVKRSAMYFPDL